MPIESEIKELLLETQDPHHEFGKLEHEYLNKYIEAADRKAGVTLALTTAVMVYFIDKDNGLRWLELKNLDWSCAAAFASLSALIFSAFLCFMIVWPRLGGDQSNLIFFRGVKSRSDAYAYAREVLGKSQAELREIRLKHCYDLAKVCSKKFDLLNRSMAIAVLGVVLFFITKGIDHIAAIAG
jgi:hypothetical protein